MNETQKAIHRFLSHELDRSLKDKITESDARKIVLAIEKFIVQNNYTRPEPSELDTSSHDFIKQIEKI